MDNCPFCSPTPDLIFYQDATVIGIWDAFPVSPGHALLVPKRHVPTWFEASLEERLALIRAIDVARFAIEANFRADGYNIGINSGNAAGQTIFHLHVHVIPRVLGDVADPRGGVRHVISHKGNYMVSSMSVSPVIVPYSKALFTGGQEDPLLPHLVRHLADSESADMAVAFTLRSGMDLLQPHLQDVLDRGGSLRILTGDYLGTTDPDALLRLLDLGGKVSCRVFETDRNDEKQLTANSFHPKAYIFRHRDGSCAAFIGSSNLSEMALKYGVEWNYRALDSKDPAGLREAFDAFDRLFNNPRTVELTPEWIEEYRNRRPVLRVPVQVEVIDEPPPVIPDPHTIQLEALQRLQDTRTAGRTAGLVVLATGLGKTWLSAFDSVTFKRVLFVAHREEILTQALETFRLIRPHDVLGRYTGEEKEGSASVLFASNREVFNLLQRLESGTAELPPGCEVTYELEVKDILRSLLRMSVSAPEILKARYEDFFETFGIRPTALEMFQEGYNPRAVRTVSGSWLGFVNAQGGLSKDELAPFSSLSQFLESLETTEMSRSFKMVVLTAMLNRNELPGSISVADLVSEVRKLARRDPRIAEDFGNVLDDDQTLEAHLRRNPIEAWIGGRGTAGTKYFSFDNGMFRSEFSIPASSIPAAQELIREIVDWRVAEYFARSTPNKDQQFVLKLSHSSGTPIIFLDRNAHPDLPEGWTEVRIDGEIFRANFVKIALNVVEGASGEGNVLSQILRRWFGEDAGLPGTRQQVILKLERDGWSLAPLGTNAGSIQPYRRYKRDAIPPMFGLPYIQVAWGQGFVPQGKNVFLFVTLDKTDHVEAFQYKDHFVSPNEFEWQSQNRTTQKNTHGQLIKNHNEQGVAVHLFVRAKGKTREGKGESFLYCGLVDFQSWSGDNPITVRWKLETEVPAPLWKELGVPDTSEKTS